MHLYDPSQKQVKSLQTEYHELNLTVDPTAAALLNLVPIQEINTALINILY